MRLFKFIGAAPFYMILIVATMAIMLAARVIDKIYPETKTSVTFMRALLGFNSSQVDIQGGSKPLGLRIYK